MWKAVGHAFMSLLAHCGQLPTCTKGVAAPGSHAIGSSDTGGLPCSLAFVKAHFLPTAFLHLFYIKSTIDPQTQHNQRDILGKCHGYSITDNSDNVWKGLIFITPHHGSTTTVREGPQ